MRDSLDWQIRGNYHARNHCKSLAILWSITCILFRNGLKEEYKQIVLHGVSLAVLFIGAAGTIGKMIDQQAILFFYN